MLIHLLQLFFLAMANIKTDDEYCEENIGKCILNIFFLLSNSVRKLLNKIHCIYHKFTLIYVVNLDTFIMIY